MATLSNETKTHETKAYVILNTLKDSLLLETVYAFEEDFDPFRATSQQLFPYQLIEEYIVLPMLLNALENEMELSYYREKENVCYYIDKEKTFISWDRRGVHDTPIIRLKARFGSIDKVYEIAHNMACRYIRSYYKLESGDEPWQASILVKLMDLDKITWPYACDFSDE